MQLLMQPYYCLFLLLATHLSMLRPAFFACVWCTSTMSSSSQVVVLNILCHTHPVCAQDRPLHVRDNKTCRPCSVLGTTPIPRTSTPCVAGHEYVHRAVGCGIQGCLSESIRASCPTFVADQLKWLAAGIACVAPVAQGESHAAQSGRRGEDGAVPEGGMAA